MTMQKHAAKAIASPEAEALVNRGLKLIVTPRKFQNGTISLIGKIKRKNVRLDITATGAVLSNRFVARQVFGETPAQQYRAALKNANELLDKRFSK